MSTKTTLILALIFAGLVGGYLYFRSASPQPAETETEPLTDPSPTPSIERSLVDEQRLDEPVKISCARRASESPWVFEKTAEASPTGPVWHITAPIEAKVVTWEVEKLVRQVLRAQYEVSYRIGAPGAVTLDQAGLNPPEAVLTFSDDSGESAAVEIGRTAGKGETYVRIEGGDEICVAPFVLRDLLKDKPYQYRDLSLWSFDAEKVERLHVVDRATEGGPTEYDFVKDNGQWIMTAPANAKATPKVQQMVGALSRLRASQWEDDNPENMALYGLKPAALTIRATVLEPVRSKPDEAESEDEPPPHEAAESGTEEGEAETVEEEASEELKENVYEIHFSDKSPIGSDNRLYMRVDDEPLVGSVMKYQFDQIKPVMSEWREMAVTTANVRSAGRIELLTADGSAVLTKQGANWAFDDGGEAERSEVADLLSAIDKLNATAFVEMDDQGLTAFGLDDPEVEISLDLPGVDQPERIAIGAYTDETLQRLRYVRHNDARSIAKVLVADLEKLMRGPSAYRNRTVFRIPPGQITSVSLVRPNGLIEGALSFEYRRVDDGWRMTSPVDADIRAEEFRTLVEGLASLSAERVVAVDDAAGEYGFDEPEMVLSFVNQPPKGFRLEPAPEPEDTGEAESPEVEEESEESGEEAAAAETEEKGDDAPAKPRQMVPVEYQPPPVTNTLKIVRLDDELLARKDDEETVYAVPSQFVDQLAAEYRKENVVEFDEGRIARFTIRNDEAVHEFHRVGDQWQYAAEPDWPIDSTKVKNLLLQMKDLKTQHYVAYGEQDLAVFGLDQPLHAVGMQHEDGSETELLISGQVCAADPQRGQFATLAGSAEVFLLTPETVERIVVSLAELEQ